MVVIQKVTVIYHERHEINVFRHFSVYKPELSYSVVSEIDNYAFFTVGKVNNYLRHVITTQSERVVNAVQVQYE